MPGHFFLTYCRCGFECELSPGSMQAGELRVMAYSSSPTEPSDIRSCTRKAGEDNLLITISESEARRRRLSIIDDPALDAQLISENKNGPWGGHRCPACLQPTMTLIFSGYWD